MHTHTCVRAHTQTPRAIPNRTKQNKTKQGELKSLTKLSLHENPVMKMRPELKALEVFYFLWDVFFFWKGGPTVMISHFFWNWEEIVIFRTKSFLESSGCRTVDCKPADIDPGSLISGPDRKVRLFWVKGTNQTKECIWGRKPSAKKLLGWLNLCFGTYVPKETYMHRFKMYAAVLRVIHLNATHVPQETYICAKRDLLMGRKRPTCVPTETYMKI